MFTWDKTGVRMQGSNKLSRPATIRAWILGVGAMA